MVYAHPISQRKHVYLHLGMTGAVVSHPPGRAIRRSHRSRHAIDDRLALLPDRGYACRVVQAGVCCMCVCVRVCMLAHLHDACMRACMPLYLDHACMHAILPRPVDFSLVLFFYSRFLLLLRPSRSSDIFSLAVFFNFGERRPAATSPQARRDDDPLQPVPPAPVLHISHRSLRLQSWPNSAGAPATSTRGFCPCAAALWTPWPAVLQSPPLSSRC